MAEQRERSHLRLIRRRDRPEPAPLRLGKQLHLFTTEPAFSPGTLAVLAPSRLDEASFFSTIGSLKPQLIVDLRVSPRFDQGRLDRKMAFSFFRENGVEYLDLGATSDELRSTPPGDGAICRALLGIRDRFVHASGVILFFVDAQVRSDSLEQAARAAFCDSDSQALSLIELGM